MSSPHPSCQRVIPETQEQDRFYFFYFKSIKEAGQFANMGILEGTEFFFFFDVLYIFFFSVVITISQSEKKNNMVKSFVYIS